MPRYFFTVEGIANPTDQEGTVLKGPEEARSAAVTLAGELLQDIEGRFWTTPEWRLQVTDEKGASVCMLSITGTTSTA